MKKNIIAVMVAATAVLSAQAFANNTTQLVIHGTVTDKDNSCNITPFGAITGGTVILDDITTAELNKLAINTPASASAKDITYKIEDCKQGGKDYVGDLSVNVSGNYVAGKADILNNEAANPAGNTGIALINTDSTRVKFDGSSTTKVTYNASNTLLSYKAAYVKTAETATAGDVKGVATFTITY